MFESRGVASIAKFSTESLPDTKQDLKVAIMGLRGLDFAALPAFEWFDTRFVLVTCILVCVIILYRSFFSTNFTVLVVG
jgi:uncharacterized membrane protein